MKISSMSKNVSMQNSIKMLEQAANLPKAIEKDISKLNNKLLKANISLKLSSSKIDTYA